VGPYLAYRPVSAAYRRRSHPRRELCCAGRLAVDLRLRRTVDLHLHSRAVALVQCQRGVVDAVDDPGIDAAVAAVASFNPSPTADIADLLDHVPVAITVEAHYLNGGLGSFVAEVVAEHGLNVRLVRSAVRDMPRALSGSQQYLLEHYGLTPRAVADSALASLALDNS